MFLGIFPLISLLSIGKLFRSLLVGHRGGSDLTDLVRTGVLPFLCTCIFEFWWTFMAQASNVRVGAMTHLRDW